MTWQEAVATLVILCGLAAGAFLVAQRPAFWVEFAVRVVRQLWPWVLKNVIPYFTKRMSPELEAEMHKCIRRGGEWDNFRKKCRDKR